MFQQGCRVGACGAANTSLATRVAGATNTFLGLQAQQGVHGIERKRLSNNALARSRVATAAVDAFPISSQITFGGGPRTSAKLRKSSSLLTTIKSLSRACVQMASSLAPRMPSSSMCVLPGQCEESSLTSRGLKFSSKSNFTRRCNWRNDVRVPRRMPRPRVCDRASGWGSP